MGSGSSEPRRDVLLFPASIAARNPSSRIVQQRSPACLILVAVHKGMAIKYESMATTQIKSTYALDVETVQLLEKLAGKLGVPKSEALRRAIRGAASREGILTPNERIEALNRLQASVKMTNAKADKWIREIRAMRRAAGQRIPRTRRG